MVFKLWGSNKLSFETAQRRRLNASYLASKNAYAFEATVEGPSFQITVEGTDQQDVAHQIKTTQAAELASMILEGIKEFKAKGIPTVDFKNFKATEKSKP